MKHQYLGGYNITDEGYHVLSSHSVFQVRLTSAPMTCFIMYSQLMVLAFYEECGFSSTSETALSWVKFTDLKELLEWGLRSF